MPSRTELEQDAQHYLSRLGQGLAQTQLVPTYYREKLLETGLFKEVRGELRVRGFSALKLLKKDELNEVIDNLKHYDLSLDNIYKEYTEKQFRTFKERHSDIDEMMSIDTYKKAISLFATEVYENLNGLGMISSDEIVDMISDNEEVENVQTLIKEGLEEANEKLGQDAEPLDFKNYVMDYLRTRIGNK